MDTSNSDTSIFQILSNKFFIIFPPDSYLSWVIFIVFLLLLLYIYFLPKRIHKEAIVNLENKLAIDLTEIKSRLNKETELLKIIRSQVEPRKVDTYIALADFYGKSLAPQLVNKNLSPPEQEKDLDNQTSAFQMLSRFFLFASDTTLEKYLKFKGDNISSADDFSVDTNLFADFMVSMRQDLQEDTHLTIKDFLNLILIITPQKDSENKK